MGTFFLNIFIGIVALAAFYNIYKGRNPIKKGGKLSDKKTGNNWFQGGMGGINQM